MDATSILPTRLDWPSAIGSFLLSFGSLDYMVFAFLKDHLPEVEFEAARKRPLAERLQSVAKVFESTQPSQMERDWFENLITRVRPLRELRNQIAHGLIHARLAPDTGELKLVLLKARDVDEAHQPETREVAFIELAKALDEIGAVGREFVKFVGFNPVHGPILSGDISITAFTQT